MNNNERLTTLPAVDLENNSVTYAGVTYEVDAASQAVYDTRDYSTELTGVIADYIRQTYLAAVPQPDSIPTETLADLPLEEKGKAKQSSRLKKFGMKAAVFALAVEAAYVGVYAGAGTVTKNISHQDEGNVFIDALAHQRDTLFHLTGGDN